MGQSGSKTYLEIGGHEWRVERVLGKGAFGTVHVLYPPKDSGNEILALKRLDKAELLDKGRRTVRAAVLERRLLAELSHPFLVNLHGALQNSAECFMVLDMMAGGDLGYWLSMRRRKDLNYFKEESVRFYVANCLLTLRYMHSEGVMHRDIKPENIMLDADGYAHLTDFNVSKRFGAKAKLLKAARRARRMERSQSQGGSSSTTTVSSKGKQKSNDDYQDDYTDDDGSSDDEFDDGDDADDGMLRGFAGSPAYCAPEMYMHEKYSCKVDLWSLGVTMYEMLTGQVPWTRHASKTVVAKLENAQIDGHYLSKAKGDPKFEAMIRRILICDIRFSSRVVEQLKISELAQDFVAKLCCPASERYGVEQAMAHPWMEGIDWDAMLAKKLEAPFKPDTSVANADNSLVIQDQMGPKKAKSRPLTDNEQALFIHWDWLSDELRGDRPLEELTCPDPSLINKRSVLRDSRETRQRQRSYLERKSKTIAVAATSTEDDDGDVDQHSENSDIKGPHDDTDHTTNDDVDDDGNDDDVDDAMHRASSMKKKKKRRSVASSKNQNKNKQKL